MIPPADAIAAADVFLGLIDAQAPGLVQGFHLVGSAVLDDWRPGASDVDFLAVTAQPLSDLQREAITAALLAYNRLPGRPPIEGEWMTAGDLTRPPATNPGVIALRTLDLHGYAVRGARPAEIWRDEAAVRAAILDNLDTYWTAWLRRARRLLTPLGIMMLNGWAPAWGVLGVARLAYSLETGDITSKTGAGRWALERFPKHRRILAEALRLRAGEGEPLYRSRFPRKREALAAMADIMAACRAA
ncbi:MAG: aminoglycoside adenylyltransferase domain-containing protein [Pseudomonadota bacterium]